MGEHVLVTVLSLCKRKGSGRIKRAFVEVRETLILITLELVRIVLYFKGL